MGSASTYQPVHPTEVSQRNQPHSIAGCSQGKPKGATHRRSTCGGRLGVQFRPNSPSTPSSHLLRSVSCFAPFAETYPVPCAVARGYAVDRGGSRDCRATVPGQFAPPPIPCPRSRPAPATAFPPLVRERHHPAP